MFELDLKKAELKTINGHRYYVFPAPPTHKNPDNRPVQYADEKVLKTYTGTKKFMSVKTAPSRRKRFRTAALSLLRKETPKGGIITGKTFKR